MAVLLGLITLGLTVGAYKAYAPRSTPARTVNIANTPEQIERGRHLADTFCASCHGSNGDLPLTGGFDLADDIPIPLGHFVSANLTLAGRIAAWSDADIEAVIAYLRSTPAAGQASPMPPDAFSPLGLFMLGAGQLPEGAPLDPAEITHPPLEAIADYGAYIVGYQDCVICHGPDLSGGLKGQLAPIGPSLRIIGSWTEQEFIATLRTGVDPSDHVINADVMPYENIGRMTDTELAMAANLADLPASSPTPPGLEIRRVGSLSDLDDFAPIIANPEERRFYTRTASALLAADCPQWRYVAYLERVPVASAELTLGGGVVGLYNIATLEPFRRRGIGRAMTLQPLLDARAAGHRIGVLQAATAGVSVYRRAGFEPFGHITEYKPL